MKYFAYILLCADETFYVGSTNDLEKRLHQHNHAKSGAHYTKIRRPVTMVWNCECENYADARAKEAELKRMTREEKMNLVRGK